MLNSKQMIVIAPARLWREQAWRSLYSVIPDLIGNLLKSSFFVKFFISGFFICFLAEGIGIVPKNILFPFFLLFSVVLSIISLRTKNSFYSKNIWILLGSFLYLLYLFYISSFSLNRQISFELIVFLFSLFLLFVVISRQWEAIEKPFLYSLLGLGVFFCIYSILLPIALSNNLFHVYPQSGYQYVYAMFGSNHLGEFLVFPMLISFSFYMQQKKKIFFYLFFFSFLFFLFSYSRAAYIGFFVGFLLLSINLRKQFSFKHIYMMWSVFLAVVVFFFLISSKTMWEDKVPILSQVIQLNPKSVIETRESYILQGLKGFLTYRYYGVGLGNFAYVSKMFSETPGGWTASSHNIFMDVLVETGTVSFVIFVIFAIILLRTIKKNHGSIYAVLLLSWFAMAQFDYIHQMYSYLLLFPLFLAGLLCHSERSEESSVFLFRHSGLPAGRHGLSRIRHVTPHLMRDLVSFLFVFSLIFLIIYITSNVFLYLGNYRLSRTIYPLQKDAYKNALDTKSVLDTYVLLFPGEYDGWYQQGRIHQKEGDMTKVIESYEKAFWSDPFRDLSLAEKIYNLKMQNPGNGSPKWFADKLFKKLNNDTNKKVLSYDQWLFMNKFCQRVYNRHCKYILE